MWVFFFPFVWHFFLFEIVGLALSYAVDDQSLRKAFSSYGEVIEGEFNFIVSSYKRYIS